MYSNTRGLVLRDVKYRDSDKILTVLTEEWGKLTVKAKNAYGKNSKYSASTQLLCYSDMTLFQNRGRWNLNEASVVESFEGIRQDILKLSLGSYIAELMEAVSDEDMPSTALLYLGLNALFALSRGLYDERHIKSVFELRLMCLSGYAPMLEGCSVCGRRDIQSPVFYLRGGVIRCRDCIAEDYGAHFGLSADVLMAMVHVIGSDAKRIFSFSLEGSEKRRFASLCEEYALAHLERRFRTLDYYRALDL